MRLPVQPLSENAWAYITLSRAADKVPAEGVRMDGFVLSIDQGTTGTTVLVFDRDCRVRGRGYSEFTQHYPRPGWVEHDAEEIWRVSLGAVEAGLKAAGVEARDLRAVGITNQRETVVAWDRATSQPVGRAVVWQDRRTA